MRKSHISNYIVNTATCTRMLYINSCLTYPDCCSNDKLFNSSQGGYAFAAVSLSDC